MITDGIVTVQTGHLLARLRRTKAGMSIRCGIQDEFWLTSKLDAQNSSRIPRRLNCYEKIKKKIKKRVDKKISLLYNE